MEFCRLSFCRQNFQWGMAAGAVALVLMSPAALTSWESLQKSLGKRWRQIHLLGVPALLLSAIHTVLIGSHYLGSLQSTWGNKLAAVLMVIITLCVLLVRSRFFLVKVNRRKVFMFPQQNRGKSSLFSGSVSTSQEQRRYPPQRHFLASRINQVFIIPELLSYINN